MNAFWFSKSAGQFVTSSYYYDAYPGWVNAWNAKGLPQSQAWWTVKRQAMTADARDPIGLYLGTTSGELWMSRDEGAEWSCIARHLPEIYAVEVAEPAEG